MKGFVAGAGVLVVLGVAIRVAVLGVDGHGGDIAVMSAWAERMAEVGPCAFYAGAESIYPALLYPLWALGSTLDGDALAIAVKGLSIPFDVGIGLLLVAALRRAGTGPALGAAALYLLNPATIVAGPVWGQVDSAGTLAYLGSLVALAARRPVAAGALATIGGMMKPQFGLVALVVLASTLVEWRRGRGWRPVAGAAAGMAGAYVALATPLALHPLRYLELLERAATRQPETSLHAFNPWGLFVGFSIPDQPYVGLGTLLLMIGLAGSLLGLRRRADLAVLLGVGAVAALAFYFLPTRVHERYLFPALALLAPFAVTGLREVLAYGAISIGFLASLLYALHETTSFRVPQPAAGWLTSDAGIWAIGLVLMTSAVAWAWLLVVRRPRWPARDPDRGP